MKSKTIWIPGSLVLVSGLLFVVPNLRDKLGNTERSETVHIPKPPAKRPAKRDLAHRTPPLLPAPKISVRDGDAKPAAPARQAPVDSVPGDGLEQYLQDHARSAESLITAARITKNRELLLEALQRFPNHPRVLLDGLAYADADPAERREMIDALRAADPDNALSDYLSALDHFENKALDEAVKDLWRSFEKPRMENYALAALEDLEEFHASGDAPALHALAGLELPHAGSLGDLSKYLLVMQGAYADSGDPASAHTLAEIGVELGGHVQEGMGFLLVQELVGLAIEERFLNLFDAGTVLDARNQTVGERRAEIDEYRKVVRDVVGRQPGPGRESAGFIQRVKQGGELDALLWLRETRR